MLSKEIRTLIPKFQAYFATQPIERAYLFGSCSRGEETKDSDVDLLVTYSDSDQVSLLSICHMMNELSDKIGRTVDMVEEDRLLPFARPFVNQDKLLIYERANYAISPGHVWSVVEKDIEPLKQQISKYLSEM